jgi:hypothetical protein
MYDEWRVLDALEQGPKTREEIETAVKTAIGEVCKGVILLAHKLFSLRRGNFDYLLNRTLAKCIQLLGNQYHLTDEGWRYLHGLREKHTHPHHRGEGLIKPKKSVEVPPATAPLDTDQSGGVAAVDTSADLKV